LTWCARFGLLENASRGAGRIRAAGFGLDEFTAEGEDVLTYGLQRGEKLFIAQKKNALTP